MQKHRNRYKAALGESFNVIGLAGAAALSVATLNPIPILGALVAEAVYLLFVPDSKWYEQRLAARYDLEVEERRKKLTERVFPRLSNETQFRFMRLEKIREEIGRQQFDGRLIYREVLRKLDFLMEKHLLFAEKETEFIAYLRSVRGEVAGVEPPPKSPKKQPAMVDEIEKLGRTRWIEDNVAEITDHFEEQLAGVEHMLTTDENLHNVAILEKRREVLNRRAEFVKKIGMSLTNVSHQLQLIEDTFGLMSDELRARSPEQVLMDIDDVIFQSESLTESIQELAPFDVMPLESGAKELYNARYEK